MRRRAAIASILLLVGALLVRRRRRARAGAAFESAPAARPVASPPAASAERSEPPTVSFVSVPWSLVEAPADRAELTVRYAGAAEAELDRVDARETPTQVFVTVLVGGRTPAAGAFAFAAEREATVGLSAPLGARELVHAATDLPAPAGGEPNGSPLYP